MIVQLVRLKTELSESELLRRAHAREAQFKALPGLVQKYYVKLDDNGNYGGIYLWDSEESLQSFRQTDLAKSIPEAYEVTESPQIELMAMLFQLRNE